ncbi:MAG: flippase-like domain-containing protein [Bacteroidetes bacterium]|nr:flippase-like domain-containing protein [Bacteroidota bacterium]MBK9541455.1 flippase-like domain-containing protein [Bacteroidota bacterium]MBP6403556.1 flippase-like domain-containing protein [Bacteroidia bacterium]MBP6649314.1 flippase-like domain-containing protein [Bacteroidia bacterium]
MTKKLISILKYILLLALGIGMLWLAFRGVDLNKIIEEISDVNWLWLSLSIAVSLVAFLSRAQRWNMLIKPTGYSPKLSNTANSLMVGYLANLAFPRLGEVTRCGSLNRIEKVPFDVLLGTVIVERALDVICLLLCIVMTAVIEFERLGNFLNQNLFDPLKQKAIMLLGSPLFLVIAVALVLVLIIFIVVQRNKKGVHEKGSFMHKASALLKGILEGLRSVRKIEKPGWFIFHTILIWFMYFLMSYLCFFALPATQDLSWHAGLFVLVVGGMGMSAPVQGGIGAYHLLVSQGLLLYGLTHEHGLAFATLMHTTQTLVVIVFGAISFALLIFAQRKLKNDKS